MNDEIHWFGHLIPSKHDQSSALVASIRPSECWGCLSSPRKGFLFEAKSHDIVFDWKPEVASFNLPGALEALLGPWRYTLWKPQKHSLLTCTTFLYWWAQELAYNIHSPVLTSMCATVQVSMTVAIWGISTAIRGGVGSPLPHRLQISQCKHQQVGGKGHGLDRGRMW